MKTKLMKMMKAEETDEKDDQFETDGEDEEDDDMTGVDYSTNQITRELIRVDKMTFSPDGSLTQSSSQRIYKVLCDDGGRYEADADKYDVEKGNAACVAAWREYVRSHEQESPWNPQVAALVAERQKGYKKKQAARPKLRIHSQRTKTPRICSECVPSSTRAAI